MLGHCRCALGRARTTFFLCGVVLSAMPAFAGPIYLAAQPDLDVDALFGTCTGGVVESPGQCGNQPSLGGPGTTAPFSFSYSENATGGINETAASASLSGSVSFGSFTDAMSATASQGILSGFTDAGGSAAIAAEYFDTATVLSDTLPAGTPAALTFTLFSKGSETCSGSGPNAIGSATSSVSLFLPGGAGEYTLTAPGTGCSDASWDLTDVVSFNTTVGATFDFDGLLEASAGAEVLLGTASGSLDPPSGGVYIQDDTPGTSFITGSGATYAMPASTSVVPEPGSLFLFGSGLLGAAVSVRRAARRPKTQDTASARSRA